MIYYIYEITIGSAHYVGSTNNFKRRMLQHERELREGKHANNILQREYKKNQKFKARILQKSFTLFRDEILRDEQRWIDKLSNCNEATASKITKYTRKEFYQDMLDTIVNNWKLISAVIVVVLTVGYGMSTEQAAKVIDLIVNLYTSFGG